VEGRNFWSPSLLSRERRFFGNFSLCSLSSLFSLEVLGYEEVLPDCLFPLLEEEWPPLIFRPDRERFFFFLGYVFFSWWKL